MNLTEYQTKSADLDIGARAHMPGYVAVHLLGLVGEVGEVVDCLKKHYRDGTVLNRKEIIAELGDALWALSQVCSDFDISLDDVATANLDKLAHRQLMDTLSGSDR